jgi:hypothetical protein
LIANQTAWRRHMREALKSPIVIFALGFAIVAAVAAPLFALSQ